MENADYGVDVVVEVGAREPSKPRRRNRLGLWLKVEGRQQQWLAAKINVHPTLVSKWVCGDRLPNLAYAVALEEVTGGAVPIEAWGYVSARLIPAAPAP